MSVWYLLLCLMLSWKTVYTTCNSRSIRLVGGSSNLEGRVEVCYDGSWGTVCDDSWGLADASVACNQLGHGYATQAQGSAHFGQGSGDILLDDLNCIGNEASLFDCSHTTNHNCGHHEDAGVTCSGTSLPVPRNLMSSSVTSTAFTLSWQATNLSSGYFTIYYQEQSCSSCQRLSQRVNSTSSRSQRVTGLSPYTTYHVYMTFTYYNRESGQSETATVTTRIVPPSAPSSLLQTRVTSTTISLSWTLPTSNVPYSLRLTYEDTYNNGNNIVMSEVFNNERRSHSINSLQPGARYKCCISAENSAGSSSSICIYVTTMETAPTGPPINPTGSTSSSTMVTLLWSAPHYLHRNGRITQYSVELYQISPPVSWSRTYSTSNEAQTTIEISLHPYYEYRWRVAAHTSIGRGPYSNYVSFRMPEDAPGGPPTSLSADLRSSTAVFLEWNEPQLSLRNGIITGYNWEVCQTDPNGPCTSGDGAQNQLHRSSLYPNFQYRWRVAARTSIGRGPYSSYVSFRTPEDVPSGPPMNLNQETSSTLVTLLWIEPPLSQRNGVISRYSLEVCQTNPVSFCKHHFSVHTSINIPLHPHYVYNWRVSAHTSVGQGPFSTYTSFQMPEDAPSGPPENITHKAVSFSIVHLFWSPPSLPKQNGEITGYSVQVFTRDRTTNFSYTVVEEALTVDSLQEHTSYMFQLSAITMVGAGPHQIYGPVTTPIGWKYGLGISALLLVLTIIGIIVCCLCQRKGRKLKINTKYGKDNHQTCNDQNTLTRFYESKNVEYNQEKMDVTKLAKARAQTDSIFLRIRNWLKQEKREQCTAEQPPLPMRRYLEDEEFMEETLHQPAIPIRDKVSICSQSDNEEPVIPPRLYLQDEVFVQGLEFESEINETKTAPDKKEGYQVTSEEEKIYQPLIPPRRYEESHKEEESVYQGLTLNRSNDAASTRYSTEEIPRIVNNSEGQYQSLVKPAQPSIYEQVSPKTKHISSVVMTTTTNPSEGDYQPLMKREEISDYQPLTFKTKGFSVVETESNASEGQYQPLVRQRVSEAN